MSMSLRWDHFYNQLTVDQQGTTHLDFARIGCSTDHLSRAAVAPLYSAKLGQMLQPNDFIPNAACVEVIYRLFQHISWEIYEYKFVKPLSIRVFVKVLRAIFVCYQAFYKILNSILKTK